MGIYVVNHGQHPSIFGVNQGQEDKKMSDCEKNLLIIR